MKNFKKGAAFGVAFAVAGLGLAAPAFAAEDATPTKPSCDTLPISERILCLKGDPNVQKLVGDPFEKENKFIEKQDAEMNKLIDQLVENKLSEKEAEELAKNIQNKSDAIAEVNKAVAENKKAIAEAQRKAKRNAKFEDYKKNEDVQKATEGLSEGIDRLTKDPARKESFKERLHRYQNDENVKNATEGLKEFLEDDSQMKSEKETIPAMKLTPAKKANEAKKGELAKTGVAVGALAGIAALSTLGGAAAIRRRNH
ncbi:hypothetical protein [Arcanobacterium phocae]|uniref:hypothetical protein n=1 Tax=Arcanobacterium phocae TaxID=131112 RepID=UPI001C0F061A|nr:hypothetical protein [Arcanobacterium phocae]